MKSRSIKTLALITRVARVRELQAQQQLAAAISDEREQQKSVDQAGECVHGVIGALHRLRAAARVDAPRLALFNQLSSHADQVLATETVRLADKLKVREDETAVVLERSRYRERAEQRRNMLVGKAQQEIEERQKDLALAAWMLLQSQRDQA